MVVNRNKIEHGGQAEIRRPVSRIDAGKSLTCQGARTNVAPSINLRSKQRMKTVNNLQLNELALGL